VWLGCSQWGGVRERGQGGRAGAGAERERGGQPGGQGAEARRGVHESAAEGGAGVMMTEGYCIVGLYLCSRPWGRRCFRARTGGARGAERG